MNSQHGRVPGAPDEQVTNVYWDETHYDAGDSVSRQELFKSGVSKGEQYQNFALPGPDNQITTVLGIKVEHAMQFAVGSNTGKEAQYQEYFERASTLTFRIGKRVYAPIPIVDLMPQGFYYNSSSVVVREKFEDWTLLREPVEIQSGGTTTLTFDPAAGLTTSATGIAPLPSSYVSGLTTDMGFFIRVKLLCGVVEAL